MAGTKKLNSASEEATVLERVISLVYALALFRTI